MNNRKARLLLRVPAHKTNLGDVYNVSNRASVEEYPRGSGREYFARRRSLRQKRAVTLWKRNRDEDAAKWRALGLHVDLNQYTGRK